MHAPTHLAPLDVTRIRAEFPAVSAAHAPIFFDNAAGTQVARHCLQAMQAYMVEMNANVGGVFDTARRSDSLIAECRHAAADFIGAPSPDEIAFGPNMTTLTQIVARAFGRTIRPGSEIITTRLEHDANVAPWLSLEEKGAVVRFIDINPHEATLDLDSLRAQLSPRTVLVAVGRASNAFGTVNDVAEIARMAHGVGALCFVDAVHYTPHGPIDVMELDCDLLVFSAYKMFGPHLGVLWGKRDVLDGIQPYHLRTVPPTAPNKFESGTQNHEGIAGFLGALEYLATQGSGDDRRSRLRSAMARIRAAERGLSEALLATLRRHPRVQIYGLTEPSRFDERVPTFSINVHGMKPRALAEHLARHRINVWSGNYYALEPMTRLGLEESGGAVRISLAHYNTPEEIAALDHALNSLPID